MDLRKIPEQKEGANLDNISPQFRHLIESSALQSYWGIILEQGDVVKMAYMNHLGYEEDIPLKTYILGLNYANQKGKKLRITLFPKNLESELKDYIGSIITKEVEKISDKFEEFYAEPDYFEELPEDLEEDNSSEEYVKDLFKLFQAYHYSSSSIIEKECKKALDMFNRKRLKTIKNINNRFKRYEKIANGEL